MTTSWYRVTVRLVGLFGCAVLVVVAAQWLAVSFGWEPIVDRSTVDDWVARLARPLREGPAVLIAAVIVAGGALLFVAWLLAGRRAQRDHSFRVGPRSRHFHIDRRTLAASLERRLEPLDRRVDVSIRVDRRGDVHLRLVTPDSSATGTVAEHSRRLVEVLAERGLDSRVRDVDVVDVRRMKARHRVR